MTHDEPLFRLQAALEAQSAPHWWPVLSKWLSNGAGWYDRAVAVSAPDPVIEAVIDLVETGSDSDSEFALALANLDFARRRAVISPGIRWSPFDGPFSEFLDLAQDMTVRTYVDVRTPTIRIAYELLGWALFELEQ
jgi:hypothetical protein